MRLLTSYVNSIADLDTEGTQADLVVYLSSDDDEVDIEHPVSEGPANEKVRFSSSFRFPNDNNLFSNKLIRCWEIRRMESYV